MKFKIETGDSLIAPNPQGSGMVREEFIRRFREAKAKYLRAHLGNDKQSLEQEIKEIKQQIALLTYGSNSVIVSDKEAISKGFDWVVEFAEVLAEGGFDIQVANPPYVRQELIKDLKPTLKKVYPGVYTGTSDLYCFFYARALQLLKTGGMLAFISSNKWFRAKYGEKLREHIADTCQVKNITDFGELPVFETAATFPMIFISQKSSKINNSPIFTQVKSLEEPYPDVLAIIKKSGQSLPKDAIKGANWLLTDASSANRLQKMEAVGIPLDKYVNGQIYYGIKTGFNKAFVIDGVKRAELIAKDPKSAEIIKPLAVGKDIRKWNIDFKDRYLLYMYHGVDISNLESVIEYLKPYREQLENRATKQKWYELQQPQLRYSKEFEKPKIVYQEIATYQAFAFDINQYFLNNKVFMISLNDKYLLGLLNSSFVWKYLHHTCSKLSGGAFAMQTPYLEKIPIPLASESEKEPIIKLVQKCLDAKGVNCEEWEKEIDERVAALYGL